MPPSPQWRRAIAFSLEESKALGHTEITPEHFLLGLCRANPCVATQVMRNLGVSPLSVCADVIQSLGGDVKAWVFDHPEVW